MDKIAHDLQKKPENKNKKSAVTLCKKEICEWGRIRNVD